MTENEGSHRDAAPRADDAADVTPAQPADSPLVKPSGDKAVTHKLGPPVVGIGASAGGLQAFKSFFKSMPADSGIAFVLIQHLDPTHESMMVDLLRKYTEMEVVQVEDRMPVRPNHLYMIPPNTYLTISDGVLHLTEPIPRRGMRMPIDYFFRSLAKDQQEKAICIILSGTGADGTLGLKAIKGEGGMAMVQDPHSAQYDGMPMSAIATGVVDFVLPVEKMPDTLVKYVGHSYINDAIDRTSLTAKTPDDFDAILSLLRTRANHDFRCYKKATLTRRIRRRMGLRQLEQYSDYVELLRDDSEEVRALCKDLLISVTSFFREVEAWQDLEETVIPHLWDNKEADSPVRVWIPGCATGEEAYSIAILLIEAISKAANNRTAQIFASDVDDTALEFARSGVYPESIAADITPERLRRFFVREDQSYRVGKELREMVVFASQNIVSDPPFSKLDLISCRNMLIYLESTIQQKLISLFHFALNEDGVLFLGPSETIGPLSDLFVPVSKKWRTYRRIGPVQHDKVDFPIVFAEDDCRVGTTVSRAGGSRAGSLAEITQQLLLDEFAPAAVLMNRKYEGLYYFGPIGDYLEVPSGDPTQDLTLMAREGLRAKLRGAVHRAVRDDVPISVDGAHVNREDRSIAVRLTVRPIQAPRPAEGLLLVTFQDLPETEKTIETLPATGEEPLVRQLEYELRATKEDLQSTIEELETSNEELKASNEEVMSMNEELQSSNEELETSKEELQSLNEELNTVNSQLQDKVGQLEATNNDVRNLLNSTDIATIFLDRALTLKRFTPATTRLLNLIPSDIGRPIDDISRKFTDDELLQDAQTVIKELTPIEKEVRTDTDRWFIRRIAPYRTMDDKIEGVVITLNQVTTLKRAESQFRNAVEAAPSGMVMVDDKGKITLINSEIERMFGYGQDELYGQDCEILIPERFRGVHVMHRQQFKQHPHLRQMGLGLDLWGLTKDGHEFPLDVRLSPIKTADGVSVLAAVVDVSERKRLESSLRDQLRQRDRFLATLSHELRNPMAAILTAASVLNRIGAESSESAEPCSVIRRQASQIATLLDDLLDVSRVTQNKIRLRPEVADLRILCEEAVEAVSNLIDSHRHSVHLDLTDSPLWVDVDCARLLQVLENLLTNAIKYTPDGGNIWLTLDQQHQQGVIRVRDDGRGIEPELLESIFDMFVQSDNTLDRSEGGMGVGLTLVRSLVELHQGTLEADSDGLDQGSEFVVRIPLTDKRPSRHHKPVLKHDPKKVRLVLVEDSDDSREMLAALLEFEGYNVLTAANGREGLELIRREKPNVALVDIGLPELDGYQVARRLRDEMTKEEVFLVALTGYGSQEDQEAVIDAGFNEHLVKPVGLQELNAAVGKAIQSMGVR